MPLIVYLDTQDYIKIFNEPDNGPNHLVLNKLLSCRDRGDIVLGFSFATIMEFITKPDAANRSERVRRGQLIKEICGPNAFPFPSDFSKGASFPNDGMWMFRAGDCATTAAHFRRQAHKALREELSKVEGLNRQQRRRFGRKATMSDLVRQAGSTWGRKRSDWGDMPVSDELVESRILERFLKGQCTDREFETRINAWLSDPAEYSRIIYDYADHPNAIEKFFGEPTDTIEQSIAGIQEAVQTIKSLNGQMLEMRTTLREIGVNKTEAREMTKQVPVPELQSEMFTSKLELFVGKERSGHFPHYFSQAKEPGYKFKRSDVMDLFQLCYAYDCNLFRCDKAMANLFKDYQPFKGKLVSKFSDLPDRVEELVKQ